MAYADDKGKKEPVPNPIAPPAVGNRPDDRVNPTVEPDTLIDSETPGYEIPEEPAPEEPNPVNNDNNENNNDDGGGGDNGGDDGYVAPAYVERPEDKQTLAEAGFWTPHYDFDEDTGEATITEENPVVPEIVEEPVPAPVSQNKGGNLVVPPGYDGTVTTRPDTPDPFANVVNLADMSTGADTGVAAEAGKLASRTTDEDEMFTAEDLQRGADALADLGGGSLLDNDLGTYEDFLELGASVGLEGQELIDYARDEFMRANGGNTGRGGRPVFVSSDYSEPNPVNRMGELRAERATPEYTPVRPGLDDTLIAGAANVWNDIAGEDAFVRDVMAGKEFATPEEREAFEERVREIYADELANGMNPYYGPRVTAEDVQERQEEFKDERSRQIEETANWTKNNVIDPLGKFYPDSWETPVPITDELATAARQELVDYASEYPEIADKLKEPYYAQNAVQQYLELRAQGTPPDLAWEQVLSGDVTPASLIDNLGISDAIAEGQRQAEADDAARDAGLNPNDPAYYKFVDDYLGKGIDPRYGLKEPRLEGNYIPPEPVVENNLIDYSPFAKTEAERKRPQIMNEQGSRNLDITAGYTGNPADLYNPINTTGGHWDLNDALSGMYPDNEAMPQINEDGSMNDAMRDLLFAAVDSDGNDLYTEFDESGNPHYYHLEQNSKGRYEYVPYYGKATRKHADDPFSILSTYLDSSYNGTGSPFKGMEWMENLSPEERAGIEALLATTPRRGDADANHAGRPYEVANMTKEEYDRLGDLFIKNMPALQKLIDAGLLTDKDITEFFFKDLKLSPQKPKNSGDKKSGSGYRSYGGRGGGGRGGGYYRSSSGGSTYFANPTQLGTPSRGGGSAGYSRGGSGFGSSGGSDVSRASEPSQTNQRQNRVYNIMKNWSF